MQTSCLFFFQAEDGIRDHCVTGVQTCALPISDHDVDGALEPAVLAGRQARLHRVGDPREHALLLVRGQGLDLLLVVARSEERRVGKECRSRWWPHRSKKKWRELIRER